MLGTCLNMLCACGIINAWQLKARIPNLPFRLHLPGAFFLLQPKIPVSSILLDTLILQFLTFQNVSQASPPPPTSPALPFSVPGPLASLSVEFLPLGWDADPQELLGETGTQAILEK